ncbi:MAG TPA: DUF2182 domain-containing protein [Jatrophihabitans sp.]|nr:DUF2182 domain-containing protein [Jatrophihabitans sp.]
MLDQRSPALVIPANVRRATGVAALTAACWAVAIRQMHGMNMGVATELGSFVSFAGLWVAMMAAMMLPGVVPAAARQATGRSAALFVGSYLAVWSLAGVLAYVLYRPHGSTVAGALVIAAGVYELTPAKHYFRRRCRESVRSGSRLGLCCVGSSVGLMLMLTALGFMNILWMSVIAVVVTAQKLLGRKLAVDVPLALAIVALGFLVVVAPTAVPGLTPTM